MNLPLRTTVQCPHCGADVPVSYVSGGGAATAEKTTATVNYSGTCGECRAVVGSTVTARAATTAEILREVEGSLSRLRRSGR